MVVDELNNEEGSVSKSESKELNLWHRASYIFIIVNSKEEEKFLVQVRAMSKDYCPGCYDLATGGYFSAGEGRRENAVRELKEETGLTVTDHSQLMDYGWLQYVDPVCKVWASLYLFRTTQQKIDKELKLEEQEVERVEFWTKKEVIDRIEEEGKKLKDGEQTKPGELAPSSVFMF